MGKFDNLLRKLNIDETYTKPVLKKVIFDSVQENTLYGVPDMNFMADVLWLPTTKQGFKFLLVICDLGTNEFDIEPLKGTTDKNISDAEALQAMKTIYNRKWLKMPQGSIRVDSGNEFKGKFADYCYQNNILLRRAQGGRHKQMSTIDHLCRQLGRLFNGYMNYKEKQTKRVYREWTDVLATVREDLNEIRRVKNTITPFDVKLNDVVLTGNKYDVGDYVFRALEKPKDALGRFQPSEKFREGDTRWDLKEREIVQVLPYPKQFRYILQGVKNASYTDAELKPAQPIVAPPQFNEQGERIYTVKAIIGKKKIRGVTYYKVHWEGESKKQASWEPENNLVEDGLGEELDEYDENN